MADLWDPLEAAKEHSADLVLASRKREMQNILKSYVGFYDPFCELLQNAMDAVDARERELAEDGYRKSLSIVIDLQQNLVCVSDNGIGFKEDQFKTFLSPNISFKDGQFSRGKKGVGATYLAYGFNYLQLGTKSPNWAILAEIKDGRRWLDDNKGIITRPKVTDSTSPHSAFHDSQRGGTFTLKFGGENCRPKDLRWVGATTAEQWRTILLLKTPLGHINAAHDSGSDVSFDLEVIDPAGGKTQLMDQRAAYIYPHTVIAGSVRLFDVLTEQQKRIDKNVDPSKLPDRYRQLNGIYDVWDTALLLKLLPSNSEIASLVNQFGTTAYGYFCYSTRVWDQFNDNIAGLRRGMRILRGGLQLATDHMPQGDLITIPLTSNIGYQNQAHVLVHFRNADPDLGRKGFQPELREAAEQIAVAIVNVFKKWRHLLKKDSGAPPSIVDEGELHNWVQRQEKHESERPLTIKNTNFFIPVNEVSITSQPCSEQDVIVLFNQLVAGGVVRGLKLMATSAHEKYDGIYRYYVKEPMANHIFDKSVNPLGVQSMTHNTSYLSKPYVLEYKHSVDALIQEFENQEKSERDINLVVAWDVGTEWHKRYSVTSLLDLDNIQHRLFHGMTHIFRDENSGDVRFYAIILSELIAYLNDVEGVQAEQKRKYGDVI